MLNFPNNPSGYTPTVREEKIADALASAARAGNRLVVILDDSYFGLVFENGVMAESLFTSLSDCHENLLAVKAGRADQGRIRVGLARGVYHLRGEERTRELYSALENKTAGAVRGNISNSPTFPSRCFCSR